MLAIIIEEEATNYIFRYGNDIVSLFVVYELLIANMII